MTRLLGMTIDAYGRLLDELKLPQYKPMKGPTPKELQQRKRNMLITLTHKIPQARRQAIINRLNKVQ